MAFEISHDLIKTGKRNKVNKQASARIVTITYSFVSSSAIWHNPS
ncbi:hypothetical protein S7335_3092 [Synechococcus sp. PCC 7335]|nr:hypothetical protein S7335_3092 [Synechococcus sp. PCC 7335]